MGFQAADWGLRKCFMCSKSLDVKWDIFSVLRRRETDTSHTRAKESDQPIDRNRQPAYQNGSPCFVGGLPREQAKTYTTAGADGRVSGPSLVFGSGDFWKMGVCAANWRLRFLLSSGLVERLNGPDQADLLASNFRIGRIHGRSSTLKMRSNSGRLSRVKLFVNKSVLLNGSIT
jgi:hypothetical protein